MNQSSSLSNKKPFSLSRPLSSPQPRKETKVEELTRKLKEAKDEYEVVAADREKQAGKNIILTHKLVETVVSMAEMDPLFDDILKTYVFELMVKKHNKNADAAEREARFFIIESINSLKQTESQSPLLSDAGLSPITKFISNNPDSRTVPSELVPSQPVRFPLSLSSQSQSQLLDKMEEGEEGQDQE